jgi:hypothetical protein
VAVPGLVNDKEQPVEGELRLTLETDSGKILTGARHPFNMTGFGKAREVLKLEIPADAEGKCLLKATASPRGKGWESPTVSRRWVQCR